MSSYSLPPPLPTYHVLLEGEGLGQALGNCKDDLLNVCMRHVEKMCKADLSRNFIDTPSTVLGAVETRKVEDVVFALKELQSSWEDKTRTIREYRRACN